MGAVLDVVFAGMALLLSGQIVLAVCAVAYVGFVARDLRSSSTVVYEILALRQRYRAQAESAHVAAITDSLTGLLNRAGLDAHAERIGSETVTAMFVDLDHFKTVNDQMGHAVGDAVLVEVGQRVSMLLRKSDVLARIGGDEFFLLFSEPLAVDRQLQLAERIIAELERPFQIGEHQARISASVGVASSPENGPLNIEALRHDADLALYEAKGRGRRQAVIFNHGRRRNRPEPSKPTGAM